MNNADKPIYPIISPSGDYKNDELGLTKREYFAGIALHIMLSNPDWMKDYKHDAWKIRYNEIAEASVKAADELLKQLEQPTNE
jgi:hypothetical protein